MSFGFRKSFGRGPFRFTVSKSGISSSFGLRGARITAGRRGTYISVNSNGFYYRERVHGTSNVHRASRNTAEPNHAGSGDIPTAEINELVDTSSEALVADLNRRAAAFDPSILAWIFSAVFVTLAVGGNPSALFVASAAITAAIFLQRRHKQKITTNVVYELDLEGERRFRLLNEGVAALAKSVALWRVNAEKDTSDWKHNAGAATLTRRTRITTSRGAPKNVESNIQVPMLELGELRLYFFPDRLLLRQGKRFGAIGYETLHLDTKSCRFIESESVPNDAQIVGQTWRYPNKNGGPDRRFKNNRQIPVVLYGEISLRSDSGLHLVFQSSSVQAAHDFKNRLESLDPNSRNRSRGSRESSSGAGVSGHDHTARAWSLFGLNSGANREEIKAAYHRLAAMYHPDKVLHLAPEFRKLADERMKEINAAYALLNSVTA